MARDVKTILLLACASLLSGCGALQAYNSHVAAREDSLSGFSKDGDFGGAYTHRVEYKP